MRRWWNCRTSGKRLCKDTPQHLLDPPEGVDAVSLDGAANHASFFQVALVVFLGFPEGGGGDYLGGDGFAVRAGGVELGDLGSGLSELLVGGGEDDATVLGAPVRTLAIHLRRIVQGEEGVQQGFVGETGRVEGG